MIFANRIIGSDSLTKQAKHLVENKRPSTFYDRNLYEEFRDNYPFDSSTKKFDFHYPPANIHNETSTFYDRSLYKEFEEHFSFNFPDEDCKKRIFKK